VAATNTTETKRRATNKPREPDVRISRTNNHNNVTTSVAKREPTNASSYLSKELTSSHRGSKASVPPSNKLHRTTKPIMNPNGPTSEVTRWSFFILLRLAEPRPIGRTARVILSASEGSHVVGQALRLPTTKRQAMRLPYNPRAGLLLNCDPLVPGAGVGDGLDDAHVADAVLETRSRADAAF
jgi:hypothetical protein